jgi:hypothetical protein
MVNERFSRLTTGRSAVDAAAEHKLLEVTVAAPIATAWAALRDLSVIRNWFGWDYEGLAGEIEYIFRDHSTPDEAAHRLTGGKWGDCADSILLSERDGKTVVTVLRDGPLPGDYDEVLEGWITFIEQLRFLLERKPGQQRRTIRLSGTATEKHRLPTNAMGIDGLHDARPGSHFAAELPGHERISGEVWFSSRHQIGLVVAEWGDSLVIVINQPKSDAAPWGGGAIVISSFGMADADFAALEMRWRGWWAERYPAVVTPPAGAPAGA